MPIENRPSTPASMGGGLFDSYAADYESYLSATTKWASKDISYFAEYKVELAKQFITGSPRRILDYGCGIGRNIPFLEKFFPDACCFGCDVSSKSLEIAQQENPTARFFVNGGPAENGRFELILVTNVFHHVPIGQRPPVVQELHNLLASAGSLFVFEHNPLNPLTRRVVRNIPFDKDAILLRADELMRLLGEGGFQICRRQYTLFYPQWAKLLRWSEQYLGWLPLGAQYFIQAHLANELTRHG